tara:strand:- start:678 stop:947 length:270 start_codon:yes stop_codon:yes gene_type:complete
MSKKYEPVFSISLEDRAKLLRSHNHLREMYISLAETHDCNISHVANLSMALHVFEKNLGFASPIKGESCSYYTDLVLEEDQKHAIKPVE